MPPPIPLSAEGSLEFLREPGRVRQQFYEVRADHSYDLAWVRFTGASGVHCADETPHWGIVEQPLIGEVRGWGSYCRQADFSSDGG